MSRIDAGVAAVYCMGVTGDGHTMVHSGRIPKEGVGEITFRIDPDVAAAEPGEPLQFPVDASDEAPSAAVFAISALCFTPDYATASNAQQSTKRALKYASFKSGLTECTLAVSHMNMTRQVKLKDAQESPNPAPIECWNLGDCKNTCPFHT